MDIVQLFFHEYFIRKHEKETTLAAKVKKRNEGKDSSDEKDEDDNGVEDEEAHDEETSELDLEEVATAGSDWDDDVDSDAEEAEIWKVRKQMLG